jgi:hypothetical protein
LKYFSQVTSDDNSSNNINLHYIRAAIEANTGVRLSLKDTRRYLLEEKLITPSQARRHAQIFSGYGDFHEDYTGIGHTPRQDDPEELTGVFPSN